MRQPAHQVLGHPEAGWYFRSLGALQLSTTLTAGLVYATL
jgi:hypothetical protein